MEKLENKVVHKFCFETKMRARVKFVKSRGATFQPWEGVFSWQTRAASSSNVWSMSIYCSVVNQNGLAHCMMIVHSGLSLLQTIQAACYENPTGIKFLWLNYFNLLLALVTYKSNWYWAFNYWIVPIPNALQCVKSIYLMFSCWFKSYCLKLQTLASNSKIAQEKSAGLFFLSYWGSQARGSFQCLCRGLSLLLFLM